MKGLFQVLNELAFVIQVCLLFGCYCIQDCKLIELLIYFGVNFNIFILLLFGLQFDDGGVSRDEFIVVFLSFLEFVQIILNNVEGGEQFEEGSGTDKLIEIVIRYVNMKIKLFVERVMRILFFIYNLLFIWII